MTEGADELWAVRSLRVFNGKELRHVSWHSTEDSANAHAKWIEDGRGKVIAVDHYIKADK